MKHPLDISYEEHEHCKYLKEYLERFLDSEWNDDGKKITGKTPVNKLLEELDRHIITSFTDFTELDSDELYLDPETPEYPSAIALAALEQSMDVPEKWQPEYLEKWIDCLRLMWWPQYDNEDVCEYDEKTHILTLVTGGWSGNESILNALSKIFILSGCEPEYKRGGLQTYNFSIFYTKTMSERRGE